MDNLEAKLETATETGTKTMRKKLYNGLHSLFIQNFGEEQDLKAKSNCKTLSKNCFLDWGRELLDDVLNKNYLGIVVKAKIFIYLFSHLRIPLFLGRNRSS